MFDLVTLVQLLVSLALFALVGERLRYLGFVAPVSALAMVWLREQLSTGRVDAVLTFARLAPRAHVSRVIETTLRASGDDDDQGPELLEEATRHLRALRVGATIASTLGLLVGILRIRGDLGGPPGLAALEAGLPQRIALARALWSMGIGVSTSAVCFFALGVIRRAAHELISQASRMGTLLRTRQEGRPLGS